MFAQRVASGYSRAALRLAGGGVEGVIVLGIGWFVIRKVWGVMAVGSTLRW